MQYNQAHAWGGGINSNTVLQHSSRENWQEGKQSTGWVGSRGKRLGRRAWAVRRLLSDNIAIEKKRETPPTLPTPLKWEINEVLSGLLGAARSTGSLDEKMIRRGSGMEWTLPALQPEHSRAPGTVCLWPKTRAIEEICHTLEALWGEWNIPIHNAGGRATSADPTQLLSRIKEGSTNPIYLES